MLTKPQLDWLIACFSAQGLVVPLSEARLAAATLDELERQAKALEAPAADSGGVAQSPGLAQPDGAA